MCKLSKSMQEFRYPARVFFRETVKCYNLIQLLDQAMKLKFKPEIDNSNEKQTEISENLCNKASHVLLKCYYKIVTLCLCRRLKAKRVALLRFTFATIRLLM